ncbi:MAG TPA: hypothetical protein PLE32_04530, partial [Haliscomenobacter sp.]|nr:hypothetical protein [Haliscomenobacter sp.]
KNFSAELGIELNGVAQKQLCWVASNGDLGLVNDLLQKVSLKAGTPALGNYYVNQDARYPSGVAASMADLGKGKIAGVYFNFGQSYRSFQSPQLRDFLQGIVKKMFSNPIVEVQGSKLVHVTVNDLKGKLAINLINAGGNHNSDKVYTYDELPPLTDLSLKIRLPKKPLKIVQQPEHKPLPFTYANGVATLKVPKLGVHSIVVVE